MRYAEGREEKQKAGGTFSVKAVTRCTVINISLVYTGRNGNNNKNVRFEIIKRRVAEEDEKGLEKRAEVVEERSERERMRRPIGTKYQFLVIAANSASPVWLPFPRGSRNKTSAL